MFGTSMHEVIQTFLTVMYNDTAKDGRTITIGRYVTNQNETKL